MFSMSAGSGLTGIFFPICAPAYSEQIFDHLVHRGNAFLM
jgi:hypothetical protein